MKKILVALDGSAAQDFVLTTAIESAAAHGGKLILFRAVAVPTELPPDAFAVSPSDVPSLLLARAEAELKHVSDRVPAERLEAVRVEVGVPWRAVVAAATREHTDLIVVGSHGYGGLDRLLGTTAAKIVDHAPCSVLVARPHR